MGCVWIFILLILFISLSSAAAVNRCNRNAQDMNMLFGLVFFFSHFRYIFVSFRLLFILFLYFVRTRESKKKRAENSKVDRAKRCQRQQQNRFLMFGVICRRRFSGCGKRRLHLTREIYIFFAVNFFLLFTSFAGTQRTISAINEKLT